MYLPSAIMRLILGSLRLRDSANMAAEAMDSRRRMVYFGTSRYCTKKKIKNVNESLGNLKFFLYFFRITYSQRLLVGDKLKFEK